MIIIRRIMEAMRTMQYANMRSDPKYITIYLGHEAYERLMTDAEAHNYVTRDSKGIIRIQGFKVVVGEVDLTEVMLRFEVKA